MFRAILRWIFLGAIYLFLALVVARALDINLFWDANSEPNVTHYNVYRDTINVDSRTNTLIITDIPSAIERLLEITDSRE